MNKRIFYVKVNDAYIPVEEVNELKNISYIQIFIQKIIDKLKFYFVTKKEENA